MPMPPAYYGGRGPVNLEHARLETNDEYEANQRIEQSQKSGKSSKPPVTFDQVSIVIEETLADQSSEDKMGKPRSESFDISGLDDQFGEDEETKRLQEDQMMDKFKLIEKFLTYWLPENSKYGGGSSIQND